MSSLTLLGLVWSFFLEESCDRLLVFVVTIPFDLSSLGRDFVDDLKLLSFLLGDFDWDSFEVDAVICFVSSLFLLMEFDWFAILPDFESYLAASLASLAGSGLALAAG